MNPTTRSQVHNGSNNVQVVLSRNSLRHTSLGTLQPEVRQRREECADVTKMPGIAGKLTWLIVCRAEAEAEQQGTFFPWLASWRALCVFRPQSRAPVSGIRGQDLDSSPWPSWHGKLAQCDCINGSNQGPKGGELAQCDRASGIAPVWHSELAQCDCTSVSH
eukprot:1150069-Pelagomonas_calceolata.AAC.3